jgi:hypothetical protein
MSYVTTDSEYDEGMSIRPTIRRAAIRDDDDDDDNTQPPESYFNRSIPNNDPSFEAAQDPKEEYLLNSNWLWLSRIGLSCYAPAGRAMDVTACVFDGLVHLSDSDIVVPFVCGRPIQFTPPNYTGGIEYGENRAMAFVLVSYWLSKAASELRNERIVTIMSLNAGDDINNKYEAIDVRWMLAAIVQVMNEHTNMHKLLADAIKLLRTYHTRVIDMLQVMPATIALKQHIVDYWSRHGPFLQNADVSSSVSSNRSASMLRVLQLENGYELSVYAVTKPSPDIRASVQAFLMYRVTAPIACRVYTAVTGDATAILGDVRTSMKHLFTILAVHHVVAEVRRFGTLANASALLDSFGAFGVDLINQSPTRLTALLGSLVYSPTFGAIGGSSSQLHEAVTQALFAPERYYNGRLYEYLARATNGYVEIKT